MQCVITSPPYWSLRNYDIQGQMGAEYSFHEYLSKLDQLMDECRRVLKPDGTAWINLGDTYSSKVKNIDPPEMSKVSPKYVSKQYGTAVRKVETIQPKTRIGIPERFYINCIDAGWYARNHIIWHKLAHLPLGAVDRFASSWESIFFFSKNPDYYFDLDSVRQAVIKDNRYKFATRFMGNQRLAEGYDDKAVMKSKKGKSRYNPIGKNPGDVWGFANSNYHGQHFATYPPDMIERIITCASRKGDVVLDPFLGSGTTALVAQKMGRSWIGIELNPEYCKQINNQVHLTGGIAEY